MKTGESYALIGDMVASRKAANRAEAFEAIATALKEVNRRYAAIIDNPLILTQGIDELSGVLKHPADALKMLHLFNIRIWPYRFRFGIGFGLVEPLSKRATSGRIDGPGFHRAAAALERARRDDLPLALEIPNLAQQSVPQAVETIGLLTRPLVNEWTKSTLEILRCMADNPQRKLTQAELGGKLNRSQQAISKALRRTHHDELKKAEQSVHDLLTEAIDDANSPA